MLFLFSFFGKKNAQLFNADLFKIVSNVEMTDVFNESISNVEGKCVISVNCVYVGLIKVCDYDFLCNYKRGVILL